MSPYPYEYRTPDDGFDAGGPGAFRRVFETFVALLFVAAVGVGAYQVVTHVPDDVAPELVAGAAAVLPPLGENATTMSSGAVLLHPDDPGAAGRATTEGLTVPDASSTPHRPSSPAGAVVSAAGPAPSTGSPPAASSPSEPASPPRVIAPPREVDLGHRGPVAALPVDPPPVVPVTTPAPPPTPRPSPTPVPDDPKYELASPGVSPTAVFWTATCTGGYGGVWGFVWTVSLSDGTSRSRSMTVDAGSPNPSGTISSDATYGPLPSQLYYSTTPGTCSAGG